MPTPLVPDNGTPQRVSHSMSLDPHSATPPPAAADAASGALSYRSAGVDYAVIDPLNFPSIGVATRLGFMLDTAVPHPQRPGEIGIWARTLP